MHVIPGNITSQASSADRRLESQGLTFHFFRIESGDVGPVQSMTHLLSVVRLYIPHICSLYYVMFCAVVIVNSLRYPC